MQKRSNRKLTFRSKGPQSDQLTMMDARSAIQDAERLRLAGKLEKAQNRCLAVLKPYPDFVAALHTLGLTLADRAQYDRALSYLHRASLLNPHEANTLTALSGVYLRLGFSGMAATTLEQAAQIAPDMADIHVTLGEIYREEKEYEKAVSAFERAIELDPSLAVAEIGLALCSVHIGELERTAEIFKAAVAKGSRSIGTLYTLSQLPADLVKLDIVSLLEDAKAPKASAAEDDFESQKAFAMAAALDKAGRHADAWTEVTAARRPDHAKNRKTYLAHKERFAVLRELSGTIPFTPHPQPEAASDRPISLFIVGPSRSGKTTLERLMGTLEGVKRGYENPIVENAVRRAFQTAGFPTRGRLVELPPGLNQMFAGFYAEELALRAGAARVFTNTLPGRNEDALRIASDVPNTRFIFIKRNIDDLILRIYMRNYKTGNQWASDVRDIQDYVTWSHEMMDIMAERMPDLCRILTYEDLVTDPTAALAMTADLCGLDYDGSRALTVGDDRNCAAPYATWIEEALGAPDDV